MTSIWERDTIEVVKRTKKKSQKRALPIQPSILLAAFIALAAGGYFGSSAVNSNRYMGIVERVIDGDTLVTKQGEKVRLASVDAPEYPKGCYSEQSKERLVQLVLNKNIKIEKIGTDNFGRTVAYIYDNKLNINKVMVTEGLAMLDKNTKETVVTLEIEQAVREAQLAKRGLWSEACKNTQKKGCVIKGNVRKDNNTRIYHLPECYNYEKVSVDLSNGDRWFCDETEAQKAGFIKGLDCPK